MKKIVGINSLGYNQKRNIAELPFQQYQIKKIHDLYKIPSHLYFKIKNISHQYYLNTFQDFGLNKVDLLHFFNAVSFGNKPWLTTFEYMCPRYFTENNDKLNAGFNALKSDACKKIIAMSDAAYQYQKLFLESHHVKNREVILNKTITILPAQKPNIQSAIDKKLNPTKFIITAVASNGFFRKGGREMVNAMDYLIDKKFDIHLHLISNFDYGDYASKSTKDEWEIVMKKINKLSSHITCYRNISNEKVIELFKQSHLGLLPTYADSFGYSVLESQSCACPVLSTDVFALPEINNNEIGWLIEVEKHPNRNAIINTVEERLKFSKRLESGLIESISHIYQNTEELKTKAYKCLEHINVQHSPLKNAQVLEGFYNKILNL